MTLGSIVLHQRHAQQQLPPFSSFIMFLVAL
jgi:hypothetical protein